MLCIFCTNSINIYAGINGLEVGQSIVIACSLLFINIVDITIGGDADYVQNHVFSATMVLPFIAASLALFDFNCYPAKVFVGDTFTYSAGVTFAALRRMTDIFEVVGYAQVPEDMGVFQSG